jgi:hypothetical protein
MIIKIAFYKGRGLLRDRFIRWWTKSPYSHTELVLPNGEGWIGIYPPDSPRVRLRTTPEDFRVDEWDFINLHATREQVDAVLSFYNKTAGQPYDWVGMILSHVTPFRIKRNDKWYCSEWVAYALEVSGIINGKYTELYRRNRLPPNVLYDIVLRQVQSYNWVPEFIEDSALDMLDDEKINRVE